MLFVTRSWHGVGGMQRYSHDLWHQVQRGYGDATLCAPWSRWDVFFPLRAWWVTRKELACGGHVHFGDCALLSLLWLMPKVGTLSVTAHGLDVIYAQRWYQWLMCGGLMHVDRVCAVSQWTAEQVRQRGVSADRVMVVPCGIDACPPLRSLSHGGPYLVSVGRLVPRKGVAWFVGAVLPKLIERHHTLHYTIIGRGPMESVIRHTVQVHGLQKHVTVHTSLSNQERDRVLSQADVFVMPNVPVSGDGEGFGIVCIEASARGIPVVAARLEGLESAVRDGETGVLYPAGDASACCAAILSQLASPLEPTVVAMSTQAHYHWSKLFPKYRAAIFSH